MSQIDRGQSILRSQGASTSEGTVERIAFPVQDHMALDDIIFEHFGHAPAYLLVDISPDRSILKVKMLDNSYREEHGPGVIPSLLANAGVNVLICRGMGRRAVDYFQQYGIVVVRGAYGRVRNVLELYLSGRLASVEYKPRERWKGDHECEGKGCEEGEAPS